MVLALFALFLLLEVSYTTRVATDAFTSITFKDIDIRIFIIVILAVSALLMRSRLVVLFRMTEVILLLLLILFLLFGLLSVPNIDLKLFGPLQIKDTVPVLHGGMGFTMIWTRITFLFFFADLFSDRQHIQQMTLANAGFHLIVTPILILVTVGTLGAEAVSNMPAPYITSTKQISVFNTIERIEAYIIILRMVSDIITIVVYSWIILLIVQHLFRLKQSKPLINIFMVFMYFFALYIGSRYELDYFAENILLPASLLLTLGVPAGLLAAGSLQRMRRLRQPQLRRPNS